jgi:acetyl-CoA C-acetyltransferase
MTEVFIAGVAQTKFGELWEKSLLELAFEAGNLAIKDSGYEPSGIEAVFVGNMLSGILDGQENLGSAVALVLSLSVPAFKVEGACASGGLAVYLARQSILSGQFKRVLVVGVEKMTDFSPEITSRALMAAGSQEERDSGLTFPGLYALLAMAHMRRYKTTEEQMASIAVKNHYHASLNSHAQFLNTMTIKQVLESPCVADPLRLLDCSPITDGAASVVLTAEKKSVEIVGAGVATDSLGISGRKDLTTIAATSAAVKMAYGEAKINPPDVDVAEVHDCFTIAEILAMEDLGFFEKGKAGKAALEYKTRLGAKGIVINTSGGLKAAGHPVGATGVKQIVEITQQLRGKAGKRQVDHARVGLTHNIGGSGATAVVHILKTGEK